MPASVDREAFKAPPHQTKVAPDLKNGEWVTPGSHGNPAPGTDPRKLF